VHTTNNIARMEEFQATAGADLAFAVGFFFSFRVILVLFSVSVLGTEPRTGAEITLALNLLLFMVVCFDSLGAPSRTFGSMLTLSSIRWVLIFLTFSGCSLLWSGTVSLSTSIAFWCGMTIDVATVLLLLRSGPVPAVSHSLMKGFIWSTCCLALIAWIMPVQSDLRLGDQEFFNTNQIGNLCAFTIFLAQYLMRRKEGRWGLAIFFLAVTLLRSISKTTIVAFLISESFIIIQDRSLSRKTKILLTIGVMVVILIFWGLFEAYYDIYTTAGNQAETLTGRTAIWAYVVDAAIEQPWIGHGFDSVWKVIPPFGSDQFEARHAENELLQQFYAYGVAGIVMLCGLYGSLYLKIRRLPRGPLQIILVSILLFILVRGTAEAEPFDLLLPLWAIVLICTLVDYTEKLATVSSYRRIDTSYSPPRIPAPAATLMPQE
jgi:exopolysaccharide production protein ExoQ